MMFKLTEPILMTLNYHHSLTDQIYFIFFLFLRGNNDAFNF